MPPRPIWRSNVIIGRPLNDGWTIRWILSSPITSMVMGCGLSFLNDRPKYRCHLAWRFTQWRQWPSIFSHCLFPLFVIQPPAWVRACCVMPVQQHHGLAGKGRGCYPVKHFATCMLNDHGLGPFCFSLARHSAQLSSVILKRVHSSVSGLASNGGKPSAHWSQSWSAAL